jgi:Ca2+-transporting ATPase
MSGTFGVTLQQLTSLFDPKSKANLQSLGGVEGIAKGLLVDLKSGLPVEETAPLTESNPPNLNSIVKPRTFGERIDYFGKNTLPPTPLKSIWSLMWDAMHDKMLVTMVLF